MDLPKTWRKILLPAGLILVALLFFLFELNRHPLVDYDEATYARVTLDTLKSGQVLSLKLSDHFWFEKPPLYFWLAMVSVKIFGTSEFVFRLPSVLLAILALWLVFLIVKKLTGSKFAATSAFLILLFSPPFYAFSREARLDSGAIMSMLLSLFCVVMGWRDQKYLFWVFPAIALGFLFKSFLVLVIIPIILIYCLFHRQWGFLKSKYLWLGLLGSLILLVPWHILQIQKFGSDFWNNYFVRHVFQRSISTLTGSNNYSDYLQILWQYDQPWVALILLLLAFVFVMGSIKATRQIVINKALLAPLISALFVLVFFTLIRTHLSTYILPALPFLAMFSAIFIKEIFSYFRAQNLAKVILLVLLIIGSVKSLDAVNLLVQPFHHEEKDLALIFKHENRSRAPLYVLDWPHLETVSYYGEADIKSLDVRRGGGQILQAPFYLFTNTVALRYFYDDKGDFLPGYGNAKELYRGQYLGLIYSEKDLTLPTFRY